MALRSRASEARAARAAAAQTAEQGEGDTPDTTATPPAAGRSSLAERRRRTVQPRGGTTPTPAPAAPPQDAPEVSDAPDEAPQDAPPFAETTPEPPQEETNTPPPAKKAARKTRSDKGVKRTAPAEQETDDHSEWSAADIRARMREIETENKELIKEFEARKKALTENYAALAVALLDA